MSQSPDGPVSGKPRAIPEATIARLALYLRALTAMDDEKIATSSDELAAASGVNSATLRKDLSYLGTYGVRGVGYEIEVLVAEIDRTLGASRQHRVALVGVGNLGAALANYPGFLSRGLCIGALFDVDPRRIGHPVGGIVVEHVDDIVAVCAREQITIGVIATPEPAAQAAADGLVRAGIRAILAFTPGVVQVPSDVDLRKVDLAVELQILAFHESRREPTGRPRTVRLNNTDILGPNDAAVTTSSSPLSAILDGPSTTRHGVGAVPGIDGWPAEPAGGRLAAAAPAPSTRSAR